MHADSFVPKDRRQRVQQKLTRKHSDSKTAINITTKAERTRPMPTKDVTTSKDVKRKTHGWTKENTLLVINWMRRAAKMCKQHYRNMVRVRHICNIFMVLNVILGAMSGAIAFLNVGVGSTVGETISFRLEIFTGCCGVMTSIVAGIIAYGKFTNNVEYHKKSTTKFQRLAMEIEMIINTSKRQRPDAKLYLSRIIDRWYKYQSAGEHLVEETFSIAENWKSVLDRTRAFNNLPPAEEKDYDLDYQDLDYQDHVLDDNKLNILANLTDLKQVVVQQESNKEAVPATAVVIPTEENKQLQGETSLTKNTNTNGMTNSVTFPFGRDDDATEIMTTESDEDEVEFNNLDFTKIDQDMT